MQSRGFSLHNAVGKTYRFIFEPGASLLEVNNNSVGRERGSSMDARTEAPSAPNGCGAEGIDG
jgi:hypothetical protein